MSTHLSLSILFLDKVYHGRSDGGEPEWPPSPLRVFQAFVAAAGRLGDVALTEATPALRWLEGLGSPTVVAPPHQTGTPVRIAVPNNDLDVVAADWARGRPPRRQPAELKTMKMVRPTHLIGGDTVRYVWQCPDPPEDARVHVATLSRLARSVVAVGWGLDLVAVDARPLSREQADGLAGERWLPAGNMAHGLREPINGTLDALIGRHHAFLRRLPASGGYVPVPPLTAFRVVGYRRSGEVVPRPFAAFSILQPDASGFRSFDTVRDSRRVAGMVRHSTAIAAGDAGRSVSWVNTFIHGHTTDGSQRARGEAADERFMFLPLPTIWKDRAESIRRVLVVAPPEIDGEAAWARRILSGRELVRERDHQVLAILAILPGSDPEIRKYTDASAVWSTVTPVILPGHEGRNDARTERMIRRAFTQAGWPSELVARADLEWRSVGFRRGVDLASRYTPSEHHQHYPRWHVRISWRDAEERPVSVAGPICVGAGRYHGLGLFASEAD